MEFIFLPKDVIELLPFYLTFREYELLRMTNKLFKSYNRWDVIRDLTYKVNSNKIVRPTYINALLNINVSDESDTDSDEDPYDEAIMFFDNHDKLTFVKPNLNKISCSIYDGTEVNKKSSFGLGWAKAEEKYWFYTFDSYIDIKPCDFIDTTVVFFNNKPLTLYMKENVKWFCYSIYHYFPELYKYLYVVMKPTIN